MGFQKLLRGEWYDFIDGDDNPFDAEYGHGSAVAGIISAYTNNGKGIAGICWYCRLLVYRVINENNEASLAGIENALLSTAIYAKNNPDKKVIANTSLYYDPPSPSLRFASGTAYGQGVLLVGISGNDCGTNDGVTPGCQRNSFPSGYGWVLTVGASDRNNVRYFLSDWPVPNTEKTPGLDVVAPTNVYAPYANIPNKYCPDRRFENGYCKSFGGTSAAAPHVAGVAALIWSANPRLSAADVKKIIRDTADDITEDPVLGLTGLVGWDPYTGYGKVNAYKAVSAALLTVPNVTPDATGRVAQVWWPEIRQLQRVEILWNRPFVGIQKLCDVFSVAYSGYFFWDGRCGDTIYPIGTYTARADGVEKPISLLPDTTPPDDYFDISDNPFYNNGSYPLRLEPIS